MTPRERWLAVLNRESFDRIPLDYRATAELTNKLVAHMGARDLMEVFERLHIDPVYGVGPAYVGPPLEPGKDVFGVGHADTQYDGGVYSDAVFHPLADFASVEEIEAKYQWPSPDWWDYSGIKAQYEGHEDQVICGGHCEEFAAYKSLRGVEQGYLDLYDHPDMVDYVLGKLYDLKYEQMQRTYEQLPHGAIIWSWVAEDVSSQRGLMISLAHIERYFAAQYKRMIDLVHEGGGYVFHHSDGGCRDVVPLMIELGIDVLDPVQWRCDGMDRAGLKRDFGDQVIFHGAMDNQHTLPFGTVEDCRREAEENVRLLGPGLLHGPCHNLQVVSPPENVIAYFEAAYEAGWQ